MEMPIELPEVVDTAIFYMEKELIPAFVSKLAIALAGGKPFDSGSEVDEWLKQQDTDTLYWVLYYTVYCVTH